MRHTGKRQERRAGATSSAGGRAGGHPLLDLQRRAGNDAVTGLLLQRAEEADAAGFDPDAILAQMQAGATAAPDEELSVQPLRDVSVQRDPPVAGTDPATTKPAGTADLLKALASWGPFKKALDDFKVEVEKSVKQTTSGKATPRSVAFTIAGLGAAVATAQPIPITPYLSVTADPIGKQGVVTLDIGKLAKIPGFDGGPPPPSAAGPAGDPFGPGRF